MIPHLGRFVALLSVLALACGGTQVAPNQRADESPVLSDPTDPDGDDIVGEADRCPTVAEDVDGFEDADGCYDGDNDADGIDDPEDLCADAAEDLDGFQDEDGCPDPDNDEDRIVDADDSCPMDPETYNGSEDEDGCPDRAVLVMPASPPIRTWIRFAHGRARVRRMQRGIIDAVVATLEQNPGLTQVTVEGHMAANETSGRGRTLSRMRAEAVRRALMQRGIAGDRLLVRDSGATRLLDESGTEEAHGRNRRVGFYVGTDVPTDRVPAGI